MIYDIHTRNKSFLKVSQQLRQKGVKNNKFMLVLYDERLVGVNPHDPNLTAVEKARINVEVRRNRWYFLREVVRIPTTGSMGIPYELNLGNLAQSFSAWKNLNFISLLPRQQGKTIGCICDDVWVMNFGSTNCQIIYLNKQFPDAIENGRRYKNIRALLPEYLIKPLRSKDDKDNQIEKYNAHESLKNQILIKSSATSTEMADKLGRGLTSAIVYIDELAFVNHNKIIYDACVPAWKTAAENAAKNGVPYGLHFTTTPNNKDEAKAGKWAYQFIHAQCRFKYQFYDMSDDELKDFIKHNSQNNFVWIQYSWQEIGRSQQWFEDMKQQMSSLSKLKRELLLEWTKSTENGLFHEEDLVPIYNGVKDPVFNLKIGKYMIDFYEKPDFLERYIMSCDVSGGTGKDNSVITFIDPVDFHIVADFRNPKIDTDDFRRLIEELMSMYFPNALLVIERNSYGKNILDYLMKKPNIEPRMFRELRNRTAERVTEDGINVKQKRKTLVYGVDTTSSSRKQMFDLLPNIVHEEAASIVSPRLAEDIANLVELPNGRIEADEDAHDDNIMSYLIFRWAVYYSEFFKQRFGIGHTPSIKDPSKKRSFRRTGSAAALDLTEKINHIERKVNYTASAYDRQFIEALKVQEMKDQASGDFEYAQSKSTHNSLLDKIVKWND